MSDHTLTIDGDCFTLTEHAVALVRALLQALIDESAAQPLGTPVTGLSPRP